MWARTLLSILLATSIAAADCTEDAMIVFDGSGSMAAAGFNRLHEPRIVSARRAVAAAIPDIAQVRDLGLVTYGPGGHGDCAGLDLHFPPVPDAGLRIVAAIDALEPAGRTPLTQAVMLAADVLVDPAAIVVVTDGQESCGGAPCALAADLADRRPSLTVHVIGFEIRGAGFAWSTGPSGTGGAPREVSCLVDLTGGRFVDTETADELIEAFRDILGCALRF